MNSTNASNEWPAIFMLNDLCMRKIVSFLPIKDRIRMTGVCRKWNTFIQSNQWTDIKELKISFTEKRDEHKIIYTLPILKQILAYCGYFIVSLTLGSYREGGFHRHVLMLITKLCPNVTSLNVEGMKLNASTAEFLANRYSNLTHITLGCCQKGCATGLSKILLANKRLKSVQFINCYEILDTCFSKLPAHSIEALHFDQSCTFTIQTILEVIRKFKRLRILHIDQNCSYLNNMNDLLDVLPNKGSLTSLTLTANAHFPLLLPFSNICYFKNLQKICLSHVLIYDEILTIIARNCKKLLSVRLSSSAQLTDFGLESLVNLPHIRELSLRSLSKISKNFFDTIKMPSLIVFEADDMARWTNQSIRQVLLAAPYLKELRILNFPQMDIDRLIIDASKYSENRNYLPELELFIKDDDLQSKTTEHYSRLIVRFSNSD